MKDIPFFGVKEEVMNLVEKYLGEGGPYRGMSVQGLAQHIKKKYGRTIKSDILMQLMAEEGLHADDDWPDMEDALRAVGVKIK